MRILTDQEEMKRFASAHELHLALGYFDGLHLGHQALLERVLLLAKGRGGEPGVLLLDPHPQKILAPDSGLKALNTLEDKITMIRAFGDIHIFVLSFDLDFAALSPEAFVRDYLAGLFQIRTAVCGYNYRFGRRGQGHSRDLLRMGEVYGFSCSVLPQITHRGKAVSSTAIRRLIGEGAMLEAYSRLGHYHIFAGKVVGGRQLGSRLGYPTANIELDGDLLWPGYGVYGAFIRDGKGRISRGIVNAGIRPTVDREGAAPSFEIYLPDFHGDLYGEKLQAALTDRIRPEKAFENLDLLKQQIGRDLEEASAALDQWGKRLEKAGKPPESVFSACIINRDPL